MHTVALTHAFVRAAAAAGMTDDAVRQLVDVVAANPHIGDLIVGTGGCRKLRFAGRGKGKSGGYRVITYYAGEAVPVFLITVFSKGERANLTKDECNQLSTRTKAMAADYKTTTGHAVRKDQP
jgi:hypothetical protein